MCATSIHPYTPTALLRPVALGGHMDIVADRQHAVCRGAIIDALSPLGTLGSGVAGGEGAIYLWAKLPQGGELCFS